MNKKYSEGLKSFVSGDLSVRRFLLPARRQMRAPMYRFCKKPRAYKEELCILTVLKCQSRRVLGFRRMDDE